MKLLQMTKIFMNNDEQKMTLDGHSDPSIVDQTAHERQPPTEELKHDLNMGKMWHTIRQSFIICLPMLPMVIMMYNNPKEGMK